MSIFSYYTLMIWFPELFYRFEQFENDHPNQVASVCDVSSVVLNISDGYLLLLLFVVNDDLFALKLF